MSDNKNLTDFEKIINERFHKKYYIEENRYNIINIENILFCDKTHLVSQFKDLIILNEIFDFLTKFYPLMESSILLPKILNYYEKNFFLFPNYIGLPESKYLYNNIHNKQRILNEQGTKLENKNDKKEVNKENEEKIIFDNSVYNSIMKGSSFSIFDLRKHKENLDSIMDINKLINEIEKNNYKINNFNNLKNGNPPDNKKEDIKNIKLNIMNKNILFYKKTPKNNKNDLMINKRNDSIQIKKIKNNLSSIYIKSHIKQKLLNKEIQINNKTEDFISFLKRKNDSLVNLLKTSRLKTELHKNYSGSKKKYIYKKYSPINKNDKFSFSINKKEKNFKNDSLNSIKRKKNNYTKLNGVKRDNLNIAVFSYINKPNNIVNYTIKNQYFNSTKDTNKNKISYEKLNKDSMINRKIDTEDKNENQNINYLDLLPKENIVNLFNNTSINEENLNLNINYKNIKTKLKYKFFFSNIKKFSSSKEGNILNTTKTKLKNVNNIITSIKNKMIKENKFKINQRILQLISNRNESNKNNEKNVKTDKNIISIKKLVQLNKKRINQKCNLKNKLLLSMENSNSQKYNKFKTLNNSNFNQSSIFIYKNQINTTRKRHFKKNKNNLTIIPSYYSPFELRNKSFVNSLTINSNRIRHPIYKEEKEHKYKIYLKNKSNILFKTLNNSKEINFKKSPKKNCNKISVEKKGNIKIKNYKTIGQNKKNGFILIEDKNRKTDKNSNIRNIFTSNLKYKILKK